MSQGEAVVHAEKKTGAKTWHVLFHIPLTSTTLPWKRHRLLDDRPVLAAECRTVKSCILKGCDDGV
jgi:hypothetical protein